MKLQQILEATYDGPPIKAYELVVAYSDFQYGILFTESLERDPESIIIHQGMKEVTKPDGLLQMQTWYDNHQESKSLSSRREHIDAMTSFITSVKNRHGKFYIEHLEDNGGGPSIILTYFPR